MRIDEVITEKQVWARSGTQVTRKFRCTLGSRKGRVVKNVTQCFAAPNTKKRATFKKTKARLGKKMTRKARRTKRVNPASRKVQALNKASRR